MVLYAVPTTLYAPVNSLFPHRSGPDDEQDYLAANAVELKKGGYLVRDPVTNEWSEVVKRQAVVNMLTAEHAGRRTHGGQQIVLSRAGIERFVKMEIPVVDGWVYIPGGPAVVYFDGAKCLNRYNDTHVIPPSDEHLFTNDVIDSKNYMLLRMIREALCNQPGTKTLEEMIEIINDKTELEFSFVMQWLAAIAQNVGLNLETNIWFIGETKGIGKGTLTRVLRLIYGRLVGRASAGEFERGWTNRVEGRVFYEVDEFEPSQKFDWGKFIKRETTNQIIEVTTRYHGGSSLINITNWIFHSNNENPLPLERDDRRNMQVLTTNKPEWKRLSLSLNRWITDHPTDACALAATFHAVLKLIDVDMDFIALAPATKVRDDNQEHNRNAVERWLVEDERYQRDAWVAGRDLFSLYFERYRDRYFKHSGITSMQQWASQMAKLVRRGIVQHDTGRANTGLYLIPATSFPAGEPESNDSKVFHLRNVLNNRPNG